MADRTRIRLDDPPENTIPKRRKRGYRRFIPPEKRRPTRSKLDNHPDRPKIEREIALGVPIRQIAIKYGTTKTSINRLRDRLPPQLKAAILAQALRPQEGDLEKLRVDESEGILGNLAAQRARLLVSQDSCLEAEEYRLVATISNVIHRNIELTGRYLGMFAEHAVKTSVNILVTEDYLKLRAALVAALRPYPEARRAVAEELHRLEGAAAMTMLQGTGKTIDLDARVVGDPEPARNPWGRAGKPPGQEAA